MTSVRAPRPVRAPRVRAPRLHRWIPTAAVVACLAATAATQTIDRLVPAAAAPGDLVIVEGSGLGGVTQLDFTAIVGGFVGVWTVSAPVIVISPTELRVQVPLFNNFIPPTPGGSEGTPEGWVALPGGPLVDFFYMEGTNGQFTTLGNGTTQTNGLGKPVVSMAVAGGWSPPCCAQNPPQPGFVLRLENATPGASAMFVAGLPESLPYPMVGDGTLVVDLALPFVILGTFPVDANGDVALPLPLPGGVGITVAIQWAFKQPGTNKLILSNGLQVLL